MNIIIIGFGNAGSRIAANLSVEDTRLQLNSMHIAHFDGFYPEPANHGGAGSQSCGAVGVSYKRPAGSI